MSSDSPTGPASPISERVCAYRTDCRGAAVYAVPVERLGEGEREVVACQDCAFEHVDGPGRSVADLRDLDASERWVDRGAVDAATLVLATLAVGVTLVGGWAVAALVVGWLV